MCQANGKAGLIVSYSLGNPRYSCEFLLFSPASLQAAEEEAVKAAVCVGGRYLIGRSCSLARWEQGVENSLTKNKHS